MLFLFDEGIPLVVIIAVVVAVVLLITKNKKNAQQSNMYYYADTVPTQLTPKEVALKYARGVHDSIKAFQGASVAVLLLAGILCIAYLDDDVIYFLVPLIIVVQISIFVNYALACLFFRVAVDKGYTSPTYLAAAFWLGALGYLLIAALPNTYANVPRGQQVVQPVQAQPVQSTQPTQSQQPVKSTPPVQQVAPIQRPATPVTQAAPAAPVSGQVGRCLQCGMTDVPLQNVTVNISGVQRTRSVCAECAAKYNQ